MTRVSFAVYIINDRLLEINETFMLRINSSSLPNRVFINSPSETTVTIMDNDCKLLILFNIAMYQ